jgi:hypothetical protein
MHTCTHAHMHTTHIYTCKHIHIYTHIHTYTPLQNFSLLFPPFLSVFLPAALQKHYFTEQQNQNVVSGSHRPNCSSSAYSAVSCSIAAWMLDCTCFSSSIFAANFSAIVSRSPFVMYYLLVCWFVCCCCWFWCFSCRSVCWARQKGVEK